MKLIFSAVLVIFIFSTDSREVPDKPDMLGLTSTEETLELNGESLLYPDGPFVGLDSSEFLQEIMEEGEMENERMNQGWFFVGGQLFTVSNERVTWALANEGCNSINARLAVLDNPQAMYTYLSTNYASSNLWFGASDINNEGTWTWVNGQPLGDGFPWGPGEPTGTVNENCLVWFNGLFNDGPCSFTEYTGYVCEHGYN